MERLLSFVQGNRIGGDPTDSIRVIERSRGVRMAVQEEEAWLSLLEGGEGER